MVCMYITYIFRLRKYLHTEMPREGETHSLKALKFNLYYQIPVVIQ